MFGLGEDYASVEEWPTGILPAHTVAKLGVMYADFNGDDIPDFYQRGCCDEICQDESIPEKFGQAYSWSRLFRLVLTVIRNMPIIGRQNVGEHEYLKVMVIHKQWMRPLAM